MSWIEQIITPANYTEQDVFGVILTGPIFQDRLAGPSFQNRTNELWDKTGSRKIGSSAGLWVEEVTPIKGWTEEIITP